MQREYGDRLRDTATPISLLDFQFVPDEQTMPTQKPVSLLEFLIKTYSEAGATVFDPTSGLFSTGVACRNTDRRFIGIEKDAKNFGIGVRRLQKLSATDRDHDQAAAAN
jgi:DNA modification methylase